MAKIEHLPRASTCSASQARVPAVVYRHIIEDQYLELDDAQLDDMGMVPRHVAGEGLLKRAARWLRRLFVGPKEDSHA